jgi:hypothetical protein
MTNDDLIRAYRERFPEGEDSSDIDSNPVCGRCQHSRGLHEMRVRGLPFGYCVHMDCDCTHYVNDA